MGLLSAVPQHEDIAAYGGDTYTLEIVAPASVTDGMTWNAQIRATKDAALVDATFSILPPAFSGGPAYVTLLAADSDRLARGGIVVARRGPDGVTRAIQQYIGVWDCEVRPDVALDPVTTLVQGTITIELDVTRLP